MSKPQNKITAAKHTSALSSALMAEVKSSIVVVRDIPVITDADVAALYGVETKHINQAVRNNPEKFPEDYMFVLTEEESTNLRSTFLTTKLSPKSRTLPKVFTEKGLYMLATILRTKSAVEVTFAIIETFATVRSLKRELVDLHSETNPKEQASKMQHFGKMLSDIVMPDLETTETESSLELNFFIGKIKHTVKRIKKSDSNNTGKDHNE